MKKLYTTFILMILSLILVSCSADYDGISEPTMASSLSYDWHTLTFTNLAFDDIFSQTSTPIDDINILHQQVYAEPLSDEAIQSYVDLFALMERLYTEGSQTYLDILSLDSSEFQSLLDDIDLTPTITDIIVFNTLKSLASSNQYITISKQSYYEYRTSITLSYEDINQLETLQTYIYQLYPSYPIVSVDFQTLKDDLDIAFSITVDDYVELESAFNLIHQLK